MDRVSAATLVLLDHWLPDAAFPVISMPCRGGTLEQQSVPCVGGDACIFASALFYSLATVRLSRLAAFVPSLQLATAKSLAFGIIAVVWVAVLAANQVSVLDSSLVCKPIGAAVATFCSGSINHGCLRTGVLHWQVVSHEMLRSLWGGYASPAAWLVLAWSALGPGALAAFLQTQVANTATRHSAHLRRLDWADVYFVR